MVKEQEQYKILLKKLIDQTENFTIQSTDEMIQALIQELKNTRAFSRNGYHTAD